MGQLEDILKHQNMVRNNIMKSFGVEISEDSLEKSFEDEVNPFEMEAYKSELTKAELDEFEKAKHQDGDMHPNGKWVWRQSANGGKGDWRVAKPSKGGRRANAAQSSENNNQQPTNQPSVSSSSSAAKQSSSKTTSSNSGLSDSKKQSVGKTPDTMVEIHKELDNKFGQENEPFNYTSNGVDDLKKNGKKGYATWVGFEHAVRGRQPVDKNKMRNFISNTAVDQFLSVVNEKSGKKYTSKDVKIEDHWDSTDMYRLYIEVDNSDDKKSEKPYIYNDGGTVGGKTQIKDEAGLLKVLNNSKSNTVLIYEKDWKGLNSEAKKIGEKNGWEVEDRVDRNGNPSSTGSYIMFKKKEDKEIPNAAQVSISNIIRRTFGKNLSSLKFKGKKVIINVDGKAYGSGYSSYVKSSYKDGKWTGSETANSSDKSSIDDVEKKLGTLIKYVNQIELTENYD